MEMNEIISALRVALTLPQNVAAEPGTGVVLEPGAEPISIEHLASKPYRQRQDVTINALPGLTQYWDDHHTQHSHLFAGPIAHPQLLFVQDYHQRNGGEPDWSQHTASYRPELDPDWIEWTQGDRKSMTQQSFIEFLDDQRENIAEPNSTEMIELVSSFQFSTAVTFRSARRLHDGTVQFTFNEDGQQGEAKLPQEFKLALPVFRGGDKYSVTARLRFTCREGNLSLKYLLNRPDRIIEDAYDKLITNIQTHTGKPVTRGLPELGCATG